jgi:hypothetical protein
MVSSQIQISTNAVGTTHISNINSDQQLYNTPTIRMHHFIFSSPSQTLTSSARPIAFWDVALHDLGAFVCTDVRYTDMKHNLSKTRSILKY